MSLASDAVRSPEAQDVDRNLALLAYGLLFFAIFFAGVPALIAVAIAYSRRRDADPKIRSHHRFQIYIFWIGFALTALAALSGLAAVLSLMIQVVDSAMGTQWNGWEVISYHKGHFHGAVAAFSIAALVLTVLTGLWLQVASSYGFIRLAMHRPIRQIVR